MNPSAACGIRVFNDLFALVGELFVQTHPSDRHASFLQSVFAEHVIVVAEATRQLLPALSRCIEVTRLSLRDGHTIFACGNGGSASDAQHFVAELVGRYQETRAALPAMALTADSSTFTAVSNDFGYDAVFSRVIEAFAKRGDVLIAISTSGNSRNVLAAAAAARQRGCTVIGLTGQSGGQLAQHADIVLPVPADSVARIQEVHGLCLHALAQALDSDPRPRSVS
jgi:D-sedoheptulose 7-phosphate isomerase